MWLNLVKVDPPSYVANKLNLAMVVEALRWAWSGEDDPNRTFGDSITKLIVMPSRINILSAFDQPARLIQGILFSLRRHIFSIFRRVFGV